MSRAIFGTTLQESETELSPEMVMGILSQQPEFEETRMLRQNYAIQEYTIGQILQSEHSGELDPDAADVYLSQAIKDHENAQYHILDIPEEEEEDEEGQEMYSRPIRQSADFATTFGQVITNLIHAEYDDYDDAIAHIAQASSLDEDVIEAILDDEVIPSHHGMTAIASCFDSLTEDPAAYQEFIDLGMHALSEVADDEMPDVASMSSADYGLRAEFAALQEREVIGESLRNFERQCDRLCGEGCLTPAEAQILLGVFEERSDRTAAFSEACAATGVPAATQLDRIQYYLYVAEQRGPIALFNNAVNTMVDDDFIEVDEQSVVDADEYRKQNGYR